MRETRLIGLAQDAAHIVERPLCRALHVSDRDAHAAMVIVAHPDDETIGLGGHLNEFPDVVIVHVTDGAPRDSRDARTHGFSERADYAEARRQEFASAMREAGLAQYSHLRLGAVDGEAALQLTDLARQLTALIREYAPRVVFTHAYEGGHPDHDAVAFAAHVAMRFLRERGEATPTLLEMPLYHVESGRMVAQTFAPIPFDPGVSAPLSVRAEAVKRAMFARFSTQKRVLASFQTEVERFRPAPAYAFAEPPNGGSFYHDCYSSVVDAATWTRLARAALAEFGYS